jgi:antitoxin component of MazEF toxin-antitoxin module
MRRRLFLAACLSVLVTAPSWAHPGHSHKVLGTIVKVDGKNITVTATDGKAVTFLVTNRTKLVRDPKTKGMLEELKAGMRAVVTLGEGEDENVATELRYAEPAATKK